MKKEALTNKEFVGSGAFLRGESGGRVSAQILCVHALFWFRSADRKPGDHPNFRTVLDSENCKRLQLRCCGALRCRAPAYPEG